jgi:hypothetical protein
MARSLADYAETKNISHTNLINKAHRQTIEAFLEKGVWKIGLSDPPLERLTDG